MKERLEQLLELRARGLAARKAITNKVTREHRANLTEAEDRQFRQHTEDIEDIEESIENLKEDIQRSGRNNPASAAIARATMEVGDGGSCGNWASRAATVLHGMAGDSRAIVSGSVDIPTFIEPKITPKSRPSRLVDLIVNRAALESNVFDYLRQSVRTTNAAPVPDYELKPTSVYTVEPIEDRARVIAHLSQPLAQRYWKDFPELVSFLEMEMVEGILDKVEQQIISGSGSGENITGLLTVAGTTSVAYSNSVPVTLRKALTSLELIGVRPTAWVLHPSDIEAIDLLRYNIDFDPEDATQNPQKYLLDGYVNGTANSGNIFGDASIARISSTSVPQGTAVLASNFRAAWW